MSTATNGRSEQASHALPPPGWYDNPSGPGQRWWDGTSWTTHRQTPQPHQGELPPEVSRGINALAGQPKGFYWAGLAVLAIIAGSLGPWARALIVTVNGTDGDGKWFLVGSLFIVGSLWGYAKSGSKGALILPALAGLFIAGDSISILNRINDASHTTLFGKSVTIAQVEWGLYACLIGGAALFLASLVLALGQPQSASSTAGDSVVGGTGASDAAPAPSQPAGWYTDPVQSGHERYWDGERWQAQVRRPGGHIE